MTIVFFTHQNGWRVRHSDFYPCMRWKNRLRCECALTETFTTRLHHASDADILVVDGRCFQMNWMHRQGVSGRRGLRELLRHLRDSGKRVVLWDTFDSASCGLLEFLPEVDLIMKKQLFRDRTLYTVPDREQPLSWRKVVHADRPEPDVADPGQLSKLQPAWNIGMVDYRWFPFKYKWPISTSRILNRVYPLPRFHPPEGDRSIDVLYRGKAWPGNPQRAALPEKLEQLKRRYRVVSGEPVDAGKHRREMMTAKIGISPFGNGEVCHRDFELILAGALLIKPDMSHIDTWPDVYRDGETCLFCKWDWSDLQEKIDWAMAHPEERLRIARNVQQVYRAALEDPEPVLNVMRKAVGG